MNQWSLIHKIMKILYMPKIYLIKLYLTRLKHVHPIDEYPYVLEQMFPKVLLEILSMNYSMNKIN